MLTDPQKRSLGEVGAEGNGSTGLVALDAIRAVFEVN